MCRATTPLPSGRHPPPAPPPLWPSWSPPPLSRFCSPPVRPDNPVTVIVESRGGGRTGGVDIPGTDPPGFWSTGIFDPHSLHHRAGPNPVIGGFQSHEGGGAIEEVCMPNFSEIAHHTEERIEMVAPFASHRRALAIFVSKSLSGEPLCNICDCLCFGFLCTVQVSHLCVSGPLQPTPNGTHQECFVLCCVAQGSSAAVPRKEAAPALYVTAGDVEDFGRRRTAAFIGLISYPVK